jgi:hypothetical protein
MRLRVEDTYASIGDRVMYGYQAYMFQALRIKRDVMSERSVVFLVIMPGTLLVGNHEIHQLGMLSRLFLTLLNHTRKCNERAPASKNL